MTQNSGRRREAARGGAFNSEAHEFACSHMNLMRSHQDDAHDLKAFGELTHVSRSQYQYLSLWLWSTTPGQLSRWQTVSRIPPSAIG